MIVNALDIADVKFHFESVTCPMLEFAIKRFKINLLGQSLYTKVENFTLPKVQAKITTITLSVSTPCKKYPSLEMDESCK